MGLTAQLEISELTRLTEVLEYYAGELRKGVSHLSNSGADIKVSVISSGRIAGETCTSMRCAFIRPSSDTEGSLLIGTLAQYKSRCERYDTAPSPTIAQF